MYRLLSLLALCLLLGRANAAITLSLTSPRTICISPCLVFFDATGTTNSATLGGANNPFQDIYYLWNFSDPNASGQGNWLYGSHSAYSGKNLATGAIAAHLYIIPPGGGDKTYTAFVTANDGASSATGQLSVTVFDPNGVNGFPGVATVCLFNSTVGSGCPAGATQTAASTISALNGSLSNKRILYKCGDTFTGEATVSGTKWSVGAYGGCEGTQSNRPIFDDTLTNDHITIATAASDGRIADIDFNSSNSASNGAIVMLASRPANGASQITLANLLSRNEGQFVNWAGNTQIAVIGSAHVSGSFHIAMHWNTNENNCLNGSLVFNCGGTPSFTNVQYNAAIGVNVQGVGIGSGGGTETLRVEACRMCILENSTINASNAIGSNLKWHSGNAGSQATWLGNYNEYFVISDNIFGPVGGAGMEVAPQNAGLDERIRFGVIERNISLNTTSGNGQRQCYISGQNLSLRNNAFLMPSTASIYPIVSCQTMTRGGSSFPAFQSINLEVYNNTCVVTGTPQAGQECIGNDGLGGLPGANSSFFQNIMFFNTGGGSAVHDTGTGNTVNHNTVTASANPGFKNFSGSLSLIPDFKPTANFSGGIAVPVVTDALGVNLSPTWDLGAVKH